jgi:hypothetical protein
MKTKDTIAKLPNELKTAANKFSLTRPDSTVPEFMTRRALGLNDSDEFVLELHENESIDIAFWAFDRQGKVLPDKIDGVKDYIAKVAEFASVILVKIFSTKYDSGELKPCELYQNNEKVVPVGIKDRKLINEKSADLKTLPEKGAVYAEHYGLEEEYERLSDWEKGLFWQYCYENKASSTQAGKN